VQARLTEQVNSHKARRSQSEALLTGRIFDDRGNLMSPSHTRKGGIKYRYYLSSALLHGAAEKAGTVRRVPAHEVEAMIAKSIRDHLGCQAADSGNEVAGLRDPAAVNENRCRGEREPVARQAPIHDDASLLHAHVVRVEVKPDRLIIDLRYPKFNSSGKTRRRVPERIEAPWRKAPSKMRREILMPDTIEHEHVRPIRAETRATLVASIARGRRWLNELVTDPIASTETIAKREGCSIRKVNMTISLAFLAPDLVTAAIEGRLPHGMGVARLCDLPAEWSRQHQMLGLTPQ
jgi:hypothetical protein